MNSSEKAFDQLQEKKAEIIKQNQVLKNHDCFSNFSPNATLQNVVFETKDLKHQFISLTSYLQFLEQFANKFLPLDDNMILEMNKTMADCNKKKQVYKCCLEEKDKIYEELVNDNAVEPCCSNLEEQFREILERKKSYSALVKKVNAISSSLDEKCLTCSDTEKVLLEQEEFIKDLSRKINHYSPSNLTPSLSAGLASFLAVREDAIQKPDIETLSRVKKVSTHPDYNILEVFYENTYKKESSVEVKIMYDNASNAIKDIAIRNNKVDVKDLVALAIEVNDFSFIMTCLQQRLSES